MQRQLIITKDGSHSIAVPAIKANYHSLHGALQESLHVFIDSGLRQFSPDDSNPLCILETGLGTGLNALLTQLEAEDRKWNIHYTAIELFPLDDSETSPLNYSGELKRAEAGEMLQQIHQCAWEKDRLLSPHFTLHKTCVDLRSFDTPSTFDLIYFDVFAPSAQPELWTTEVFANLYKRLRPGGILVTYCSKSVVRRAMQAAGFKVEKPPGPWGKREMVRAKKILNFEF